MTPSILSLGKGIVGHSIHHTPFAVVDFETTGFDPRGDRVVEVAIRRFDPVSGSVVAFDTLVNPDRPMAATQYHGIRHDDVQAAPTFKEIAGTVVDLLAGAVFTSYNVSFDARFLDFELQRLGINVQVPQLCLMLLKPMLDLGSRTNLHDACAELGVSRSPDAHVAAFDAAAAEGLLRFYLSDLRRRGVLSFKDLTTLRDYSFLGTFQYEPLPPASHFGLRPSGKQLSRRDWPPERRCVPGRAAIKTYFDALTAVFADMVLTEAEYNYMMQLQARLHLTAEQLRAQHARAFLCIMMNFIGDDWFDDEEIQTLHQVSSALARLGWSPGQL